MEHDSDSFEFQPTSGKRALNRTLCNGSGAMNTNQTSCIGWHQKYSPYSTSSTTAQNAGAWSTWGCTQGATVLTAIAQTHTHKTHTQRQGHHTTCLNFCTDKSAVEARTSEPLKKSFLTASSSFWVSSSILLMSSIVSSIHLSIQQKSWRWKLVNILFSCFKKINKH